MCKLEELKNSLIEEVNKRMTDKIIEPTNAELLVKLIKNAESETEALAIAELGTTYRRTGFHFDKRLEIMGSDINYLAKNKELSFDSEIGDLVHKLIIGDNYKALRQLLITYKRKINLIYIDPPYAKDSMGKFAETNYTNTLTRDNLLSMLYPRLILAKELLSDDGIIYCSIDDRNQAYVKCLFDDIFGEENFIANLTWYKGYTKSMANFFGNTTESILAYSKDINVLNTYSFKEKKKGLEGLYAVLEDGKKNNLNLSEVQKKVKQFYTENTEIPNGLKTYTYVDEDYRCYRTDAFTNRQRTNKKAEYVIMNPFTNQPYPIPTNGWRVKEDTFELYKSQGRIKFTENSVQIKFFIDETEFNCPSSLISNNEIGGAVLKKIIKDCGFSYPKPPSLIKYLIGLYPQRDITVLDFFAGSGTTGQAVLELNREDGGNRKFILATNNEESEETPLGIVKEVTSKRLKRIMTGCCYDGFNSFEWLRNNKPYGDNLEVCEIKEVNNTEIRDGKSAFEVIDETLYGLPKFTNIEEKINWVCNNFENTQKYIKGE